MCLSSLIGSFLLAEQHLNEYQEWTGFKIGVELAVYLLKVNIHSNPLCCGPLHVSKFESLILWVEISSNGYKEWA